MTLVAFCSTPGGCTYYRGDMPAYLLEQTNSGIRCIVTDLEIEFGSEGGIAIPGQPDPDVVVMAAGWLRTHVDVLQRARAVGQKVIADCDDWPWLPKSNPAWTPDAAQHKLDAMRVCDAVIVSTPYLQRGLKKFGIDAVVARNLIHPPDYLGSYVPNRARRSEAHKMFRVGYRGVLAGFHDGDVAMLRNCLPDVDGIEYVHVGADPRARSTFASLTDLSPARVTNRQAVPFGEPYFKNLYGIALALIPLCDRPFNWAKSNIAALEWTAAGVPWFAVGNATKPEFGRILSGASGVWPNELDALIHTCKANPEMLADMADEQAEVVERDFDVRCATAEPWLEALRRAGVALPRSRSGPGVELPQVSLTQPRGRRSLGS